MGRGAVSQGASSSNTIKYFDTKTFSDLYDFSSTWQSASGTPVPATVPETVSGTGVKKEPHKPPPVPKAELEKIPPPPTMTPAQEAAMLLQKSFSAQHIPEEGVLPRPFPGLSLSFQIPSFSPYDSLQ